VHGRAGGVHNGFMTDAGFDLTTHPVHLGVGATAAVLGAFTGDPAWFERYASAHESDGAEGRLVMMYRFEQDWDSWEVHPHGHEVVVCVQGRVRLHQEMSDGAVRSTEVGPGEAVINEPGVWHTADVVDGPVQALFITAGLGTEHRPR
jgi:mannose-6-phosphate isomerase-like protein (cupin superfamily)